MPKAVVEDWNLFSAFLAAQPLIQWSLKKQQEMARGLHDHGRQGTSAPPKNDNADLAAALASMA